MDHLLRLLPSIVRASGGADEVAEAAAIVAWGRVAGDGLRAHAVPFRLYRRTLVVAVADSTWQKQLEPMSGQLLFKLNSLLGQALVTYIEFRIDSQTVIKHRDKTQASVPVHRADIEERALKCVGDALGETAAANIHDESLRSRFLLAAGSCIARRESEEP